MVHPGRRNPKLVVATLIVIIVYFAMRVLIFGNAAFQSVQEGFILGTYGYEDMSQLSPELRTIAAASNIATHLIAIILPVFGERGEFLPQTTWLTSSPTLGHGLWLALGIPATVLLWLAAMPSPLRMSAYQRYAVGIIVINAVVHFALFRDRTMYLAQLGFVLFVVGSPHVISPLRKSRWGREQTVILLAAVLALASLFTVKGQIEDRFIDRQTKLSPQRLAALTDRRPGRIDTAIVERVLRRYG
jgi:hypothetical protein